MDLAYIFSVFSYLILSMSCVDSYVLFAANIDDFRSLAHKIIPNQLAEQLANMAVKQNNMNYRHKINKVSEEYNYESSNSDDTEDSNYSDSYFKTATPQVKDKDKPSKKKYLLHNETIDLDELVKRVKEKLEKDYNVTTDVRNEADINVSEEVMTGKDSKIEDYYYKDDNMNGDFNKNTELEVSTRPPPKQPAFTKDRNKYEVVSQYDGVNIDYNNEDGNDDPEYVEEDNVEKENVENQNMDYDTVTEKQQYDHLTTLKAIVRDGKEEQEDRKFDEYGSLITKQIRPNVKKVESEVVLGYYEDNTKPTVAVKIISNPKELNAIKNVQPNVKKAPEYDAVKGAPEYYDDNAKDVQADTLGANGDIFKEIDMLKSTNDSYEDYVTPKRDNIFDSGELTEKTPVKPILGVQKFISKNTEFKETELGRPKAYVEPLKAPEKVNNEVIKPPVKQISAITPHPEFIRAKTASMWYKDPNIENYDDSTKKLKENANKKTTKKHLRTMFPTKMHVKISSPNYFAKLPAVAEKYNFNEPIPEKDREPELIKHIGNPPALINKKVKI